MAGRRLRSLSAAFARLAIPTAANTARKQVCPPSRAYSSAPLDAKSRLLVPHTRAEKERELGRQLREAVEPIYLKAKPIKPPKNKFHVGTLTAYGYDTQKLNWYANFAINAARALNMPCSNVATPTPKLKKWTVRKSPFVHKKKDKWEQITYFREVHVYNTHPDVLDRWMYYLTTNVGTDFKFKFNRITYDEIGVGKRMLEEERVLEAERVGEGAPEGKVHGRQEERVLEESQPKSSDAPSDKA